MNASQIMQSLEPYSQYAPYALGGAAALATGYLGYRVVTANPKKMQQPAVRQETLEEKVQKMFNEFS